MRQSGEENDRLRLCVRRVLAACRAGIRSHRGAYGRLGSLKVYLRALAVSTVFLLLAYILLS